MLHKMVWSSVMNGEVPCFKLKITGTSIPGYLDLDLGYKKGLTGGYTPSV